LPPIRAILPLNAENKKDGERAVPIYIGLMNYTEQGLKNLKRGSNWAENARTVAEDLGGEIEHIYLTMSSYDLVALCDFPDDATAAPFMLRMGAAGDVHTTTLKAFPEDAYRAIIDAV